MSRAAVINIEVERGCAASWTLTVTDPTGGSHSLVGDTVLALFKKSLADPDAGALITKSLAGDANGQAVLTLTGADTAGLLAGQPFPLGRLVLPYAIKILGSDVALIKGTLTVHEFGVRAL